VAQWLRCCATNRKVAGSIAVWLGSTQPLTEMSPRVFPGGYRPPVRKVDNLPPSCTVVTKSGNLNFLELSGPVQACIGTASPLPK